MKDWGSSGGVGDGDVDQEVCVCVFVVRVTGACLLTQQPLKKFFSFLSILHFFFHSFVLILLTGSSPVSGA